MIPSEAGMGSAAMGMACSRRLNPISCPVRSSAAAVRAVLRHCARNGRGSAADHTASIQGRVIETYTGDEAEADIDSLAQKYLGQSPYPWRKEGEQRVSFVIEPTHVYHQDP